ncbi:TPA: lasso peptide biosynthesis B2 protein [Klebsiella pneumoniae]|uniref:lasso peptide biosynthesis B2 protein n=1 Tax=Klebsiella pneumoniae TaxID=573 RepID=UPI0021B03F18|nr:lasso peptide biosynthesis B2 protein [Klebsiella pneumoniae]UWX16706.1 lasso peptide biosynthesis B2 protein [Klebsiella pneumoniae]UWX22096.1 lasso peptide biosynthesis B2 protein [Klebsiella pneumoniae]HBQ5629562.1 lasso peptide biosynthesis B2 protein [Klebsiella pneumoniae]HCA7149379.1 lasso peptide biosynthesis B2 protein [Klebsiella pneumoniae]
MFNMNHYLRFSIYKNDLVIIDINNDEFFIMNDVNHENIRLLTDVEEELLAAELIQSLTPIDGNNENFYDERWLPRKASLRKINPILLLKAYSVFVKCKKNLDSNGYYGVIYNLQNIKKNYRWYKYSPEDIINCLNFIMPFKHCENPCLIYSYALVTMLRKATGKGTLVVGVRTRPFISHAWVELDGEIISDNVYLRDKLSVIMEV